MKKILRQGLVLALLLVVANAKAQRDFIFTDAQKPDSFAVAFQLKDSLIRVTARVNGKATEFVLDNGCPYLVINSRYWKTGVPEQGSVKARGVGGSVAAGAVLIDSFYWEGLQKQHFKAITADLPHLGDSIGGLIGLDVYKDYRVTFDFKGGLIQFKKAVPTGEMTDSVFLPVMVPFVFSGHIPVVHCTIEQEKIKMGIDCAAFPNLIAAKFLSGLKDVSNRRTTLLRGAGTPVTVVEGNVGTFLVNDLLYGNMKFTFDDASLSQINQGRDPVVDGLLGIPFLMRYKTVIDFANHRVEVYKDQ